MNCPQCDHPKTEVIDTTPKPHINSTKRRRQCLKCGYRFNTFEFIVSIEGDEVE